MVDIVILGAGPAGLSAAMDLAESGVNVTLLEVQDHVGGTASSFNFDGINVDYGSHRLHPASDPAVLTKIRGLLGDDLLTRPRHGRIRLMGRWIHFPLRPVDLILRMHPKFSIGVAIDLIKKILPASTNNNTQESFATVLQRGLGNTICKEFYFPYAKKIWGLEPEELSEIQAKKRISAGSIGKMIKRLLPGAGKTGGASTKGIFYYPRKGFGQICESIKQAAIDAGAEIIYGAKVTSMTTKTGACELTYELAGKVINIKADQIFSTIPISILTKLINQDVPAEVINAGNSLRFRSMVLAYVKLEQTQFTEFDAHYFPGTDLPFTRVSEPKNYTDVNEPTSHTILCVEIPCFVDDENWKKSDAALIELVSTGLKDAGLPIQSSISEIKTIRLPHAYPLYTTGYEAHFTQLDKWVDDIDGLLSFGRLGLYAHDNTHHAIYMAQAAVSCLKDDASIDRTKWNEFKRVFEKHVVED